MLSLRQIEVFWAIMQARTVSGAARILNVSQPGLSRMLQHMEGRLGLTLFQRAAGRLVPTPEAEALYERADRVHAQVVGMQELSRRLARGEGTSLAIGSGGSVANWPLAIAMAEVKRTFPAVAMRLDVLSLPNILDYLLDGRGDAVIGLHGFDHPAVNCQVIGRVPMLCAVPRGHPLAQETRITAGQLREHPLIMFDPETPHGRAIAEAIGPDSVAQAAISAAAHARLVSSALGLAEAGLGVVPIDGCAAKGNTGSLLLIPFWPAVVFRVHLLTAKRAPPPTALRHLIVALERLLAEEGWNASS